MTEEAIPGPEEMDPILLSDGQGFRATISLENWLTIGVESTVDRPPRQGPWVGSVTHFEHARLNEFEWFLSTGERRNAFTVGRPESGLPIGASLPIKLGGNSWDATVMVDDPAIQVDIKFRIQSGTLRRRSFYRKGRLETFFSPCDNGMGVYRVKPPAFWPMDDSRPSDS
jgi:hypothetical protein